MTINIYKKLVIKDIQKAEDIIDALVQLGGIDNDFDGTNGDGYLWSEAKNKGFTTNAAYLADYVVFNSNADSRKYGIKAYTDRFAVEWLKRDSYYTSIEIDIVKLNGAPNDPHWEGIYAFNVTVIDTD